MRLKDKKILKGIKHIKEYLGEKYQLGFTKKDNYFQLIEKYAMPVKKIHNMLYSTEEDIDVWMEAMMYDEEFQKLKGLLVENKPIKRKPRVQTQYAKKSGKVRFNEARMVMQVCQSYWTFKKKESWLRAMFAVRLMVRLKINPKDIKFILNTLIRAVFIECEVEPKQQTRYKKRLVSTRE